MRFHFLQTGKNNNNQTKTQTETNKPTQNHKLISSEISNLVSGIFKKEKLKAVNSSLWKLKLFSAFCSVAKDHNTKENKKKIVHTTI